MKAPFQILLLIFVLALRISSKKTLMDEISQSVLNLTKDLFHILTEENGNIIFSPLGVHDILIYGVLNSRDTTKETVQKVLGMPFEAGIADVINQNIRDYFKNMPNVTTEYLTKIYMGEGRIPPVDRQFPPDIDFYPLENVDFSKGEIIAPHINAWVEDITQSKINHLVSPKDLDKMIWTLAINVIYFKSDWEQKFDKALTKKGLFYGTPFHTVNVDMMESLQFIGHKQIDALEAAIVRVPFANKDFGFYIILPERRDGLNTLQEKINSVDLGELFQDLVHSDVVLKLPKFKIEQKIDFEAALRKLGLGIIYERNQDDFRTILTNNLKSTKSPETRTFKIKTTYVSKFLQKSFFEVNEEGAEAAGTTDVINKEPVEEIEPRKEPRRILVDHPFIFMLVSTKMTDGSAPPIPLFVGKIENL